MKILLPFILVAALNVPLGSPTKIGSIPFTPTRGVSYYAWSPDSKKIVFTFGLPVVSNSDGTDPVTFTHTDELYIESPTDPAWSPDGSRIAFVNGDGPEYEIYVANADGTGLTDISIPNYSGFPEYVYDTDPVWSLDSNRIFFTASEPQGGRSIHVMDADGKNRRKLTNGGFDYSPVLSPDGSKIAFIRVAGGKSDIYLIDADGTNEKRLTNDPFASNAEPVWSPNGSKIMFTSTGMYTYYQIYLMDSDGSNVEKLTNNDFHNDESTPAWSPNGSLIAYSYADMIHGSASTYIVNLNDNSQVKLTTPGSSFTPIWSPNGTKLLFSQIVPSYMLEFYVQDFLVISLYEQNKSH